MNNALILIVEDEFQIAKILDAYLTREGFRTVIASDGQTALTHHSSLKPDLILLDVNLPRMDGYEVLSNIRSRANTPVIMVTAMGEDLDKLQGLRIGADDYIVKPFNPVEVVARVKAVLRRAFPSVAENILRVGSVEVDQSAREVTINTNEKSTSLDLTPTEFRILAHMARFPRRAFTRSEIVDACLPEGDALERTLDSHISNLRRKLENSGAQNLLVSVRGVGYRLG